MKSAKSAIYSLPSFLGAGACLAALLVFPACGDTSSAAQQTSLPATGDPVVGEIDGRRITLKEVDEKWAEFDAAAKNKLTQELYQNRRNMLDQIFGEAVLAKSAKAAGLSVEDYVARESAKLAAPVTEADVKAFYEQNKDRTNGRTLDQLRKPVTDFLEGQRKQQAKAMLVGSLMEKDTSIKVLLDPPRYTVEVASDDPVLGESTAPITLVEFSDYQ
jgi:hypothetical protein